MPVLFSVLDDGISSNTKIILLGRGNSNKLFTNQFKITDEYNIRCYTRLLGNEQLITIEQKGRNKNSRGAKVQLLIDKITLENCKEEETNLNVAWINYKKPLTSCYMTGYSNVKWIGIHDISNFVKQSMASWTTQLTASNM